MSVSQYIEEKYGAMTEEEYAAWKASEPYKMFIQCEPSWTGDTAEKEILSQQFQVYLVDRALSKGAIINQIDLIIRDMEALLSDLLDIATYTDDRNQSNMAIEKAMRVKLALVWMQQGAPKGMTINTY